MRDIQQLHDTGRDSERQPETVEDSGRHAATLWDRRDSERQLASTGDNMRQTANIGDSDRHAETPWDTRDSER